VFRTWATKNWCAMIVVAESRSVLDYWETLVGMWFHPRVPCHALRGPEDVLHPGHAYFVEARVWKTFAHHPDREHYTVWCAGSARYFKPGMTTVSTVEHICLSPAPAAAVTRCPLGCALGPPAAGVDFVGKFYTRAFPRCCQLLEHLTSESVVLAETLLACIAWMYARAYGCEHQSAANFIRAGLLPSGINGGWLEPLVQAENVDAAISAVLTVVQAAADRTEGGFDTLLFTRFSNH
jgi:hypothetical protein